MDGQLMNPSRDEYWRLQEAVNELSATQAQHGERIMRLEKRQDDGSRARSVWGPSSPFPGSSGASHNDSGLNPAAEAFRNFDADPPNMISSLTLDGNEDARRAAASRANSVRFDESANNHYGPSRSSMELPTRTGSGLGSHPLSERSLSHRSERGSTSGFPRANSFGLESSRLLGSIHNSPRVSGNPPPGFFMLGPCPSIIRCWLTEHFSNESLLYVAICSGSAFSSISLSLLQKLGLADSVIEENGLRKVKLLVYLTEARIQFPSSRSPSPAPQVPSITAKFVINDQHPNQEKSIQIVLGSDVLREHSADVLFSQDKVMINDDDRNQLSIPLVRPEDDAVYKSLSTQPRSRRASATSERLPSDMASELSAPGIIGRPSRTDLTLPSSSGPGSPLTMSAFERRKEPPDFSANAVSDPPHMRTSEDSKSTTGSEKSATTPGVKPAAGVWSNSWRSNAVAPMGDFSVNGKPTATGTYARPNPTRPMKVLRPSRAGGLTSATRSSSGPAPFINGPEASLDMTQIDTRTPDRSVPSSATEPKAPPSKSNPVGGASAFGWLAQPQRSTTTSK